MTIHLPEDLERFVQDAVRAGRYPREDDVIRDALTRLRQDVPGEPAPARRGVKRAQAPADEEDDRGGIRSAPASLPDPA